MALSRKSTPPASGPVFDINFGNFVSLSHLTLAGGQYGVWVHGGSSNFTGSFLTIPGSTLDGIRLEADSSTNATLDHITASSSGRDGISVGGVGAVLTNSISHDNVGVGIRFDNSGAAVLTGNLSYTNRYGLLLTNGVLARPPPSAQPTWQAPWETSSTTTLSTGSVPAAAHWLRAIRFTIPV